MVCKKCGTNLPESSNFCLNCGAMQNENETSGQSINDLLSNDKAVVENISENKLEKTKIDLTNPRKKSSKIIILIVSIILLGSFLISIFYFFPTRDIKMPKSLNSEVENTLSEFLVDEDVYEYLVCMVDSFNNRTHGLGFLYTENGDNDELASKYKELKGGKLAFTMYGRSKTKEAEEIFDKCMDCYESINWLEINNVKSWDENGNHILGVKADRQTIVEARQILENLIEELCR